MQTGQLFSHAVQTVLAVEVWTYPTAHFPVSHLLAPVRSHFKQLAAQAEQVVRVGVTAVFRVAIKPASHSVVKETSLAQHDLTFVPEHCRQAPLERTYPK